MIEGDAYVTSYIYLITPFFGTQLKKECVSFMCLIGVLYKPATREHKLV